MGCTVTINDKLNIKNSGSKDFSTEESFDQWLFENKKAIKRAIAKANGDKSKLPKSVSPTFMINMTPTEERIAKFEQFQKELKEAHGRMYFQGVSDDTASKLITIGTTSIFSKAGNKDNINKPVAEDSANKSDYINYQMTKKGKTAVEAENMWNKAQIQNSLKRIDGTIIGALIQDELTGTDKDEKAIRTSLKNSSDLKLTGLTIEDAFNRVKTNSQYKAVSEFIKKELKKQHGENCKIFTEFEVISKELSPEFEKVVSRISQQLNHKKANAIRGFIDILVLDENGFIHSYDIKTSSISVNDWWSGTKSNFKYDEISAQQMANAAIVEQYGQFFTSINIYAINEILDEDGNITSLNPEGIKTFGMTNDYAEACHRYFPSHTTTDPTSITNLATLMSELYPDTGLDTAAQTKKISKDFIMNKKAHKMSDGKWHLLPDVVFEEWKPLMTKHEIVFDTREEMERFVAEEYVPKMNSGYSKELQGFSEDLRRISRLTGVDNKLTHLQESARGISKDKKIQNFIINKFKKFVIGGWDLVSDSENRLAEYGIFIFAKDGFAEVVMIDKTDLSALVKLGITGNTTVLGNLKNDLSRGSDDTLVMPSTRGNLMLMKAMAYISQNENLFRRYKIQAVRAINLRWGQEVDENLDKLVDNWNYLSDLHNATYKGQTGKHKLRTLGKPQFLSSVQALVQRAENLASTFLESNINFKGHKENLDASQDDTEDEIKRYMKNLVASDNNLAQSGTYATYSYKGEAYILLTRALLAVRGWNISIENDKGPIFWNGVFIAGTESLSPAESTSSTIRIFNQIETTYEQKVRDVYESIIRPWQNQMVKVYEEAGINQLYGNERNLFRNCYQKDENGEISKDFVLIPPDKNKFLNDRPELKKLVEMFLENINEQRFPDEEERLRLKSIEGSMYYQVPLTETNFVEQVKQDGIWNAMKRKAKNLFTEVQNFAYGAPMSSYEIEQYGNLDREFVYDPYLDVTEEAQLHRAKLLSGESVEVDNKKTKEYGVNAFEVGLDTIFLRSMASATKSFVSREFMPLFTGIRMILEFNQKQNGMQTPEITEAINKFIKSTVLNQLIIKPSNQTIYHILGILKGITSKLTLALNPTTFAREMTSSTVRTAISLTGDKFMEGKFNVADYLSELLNIVFHSHENYDVRSKYMQSNFRWGLANVSQDQLAEMSKSNYLNPANWEENLLFESTTMPDFVHRNALYWAFLKKRGSAEAYSMVDGVLTYDMTKDKAYETFLKYKDHFDAIPDRKTEIEYIKQRKLYEIALDDWNAHYGYDLEYGEYLPEALSPTESNAIRVYADHLYGNYDSSTKSLIQKSLVGSLIMQFKTFQLQQFLQDVRGKGTINITTAHHMTTTNGKKIYRKPSVTREELETHGMYHFMTEDELETLSSEDLKDISPFIVYAGTPTVGRIYSDLKGMYDVLFHRDEFLENWKNSDVYKANLYISLFNNLGMLLIAMLLKLLYGEDVVENPDQQNWWTRWTYTVLMGVAKDGPLDQSLTSILSGTPPSISVLQSFYRNAYNLITDEDPSIVGFMKLFGATRSFVGAVSQ